MNERGELREVLQGYEEVRQSKLPTLMQALSLPNPLTDGINTHLHSPHPPVRRCMCDSGATRG